MKLPKFALLAAAFATVACGGGSSTGGLDAEAVYTVSLTSAAEVPAPKPTTSSGSAQVILYPQSIDYQVNGSSLIGVTQVHIHNGAPGVQGPVVVTLLSQSAGGTVNGTLVKGQLTAANLPGGVTLESLKTLILSGNAYVNIHTSANPSGELRGQIR